MVSGGRHPVTANTDKPLAAQKNPPATPAADGDNPPLKDRHSYLRNQCNRIKVALADNRPDG